MKSFLLTALLIFNNYCFQTASSTTVYLCNSTGGKKYHLSAKCRGLSNCQHQVIQTTLEKAKRAGKTLCKWEN